MLTFSCALAYTYIVATKSAYVTGTDAAASQRQLAEYGGSPLRYRDNGRAIASVVFLWPGMVFTFVRYVSSAPRVLRILLTLMASTYLLWHSLEHIDIFGPKSTHARARDSMAKPVTEKPIDNGSLAESTVDGTTLTQPGHAHSRPEGFHDRNASANQQKYSAV
jgi:hypothetical protein